MTRPSNNALVASVAMLLLLSLPVCHSFLATTSTLRQGSAPTSRSHHHGSEARARVGTTVVALAGKGFGSASSGKGGNNKKGGGGGASSGMSPIEKTYDRTARGGPIRDLIDDEAAMSDFFGTNSEWTGLFRSLATSPSVPAMSFLTTGDESTTTHGAPIEFGNENDPWTQRDAIPTSEDELPFVAAFLDSMQQSLIDIPVTESKEQDENDLHFIEEGRRMLVLSRFHVLPDVTAGCIDSHRTLFETCWSELAELRRADEADTGSLIIVPRHDLADLRRFVDMNLQRPLDWLGLGEEVFEVTSLQRESPAIRLIHRLSDIPDVPEQQVEE